MTQSEKTMRLTVELPEPVIRLLSRLAELTHQSPEAIAAQSITGNLPPSVENFPARIQEDLLFIQTLPVATLHQVAQSQVAAAEQTRHFALLSRLEQDNLTPDEEQELRELRQKADQLMLRKAYAWALLRWHGVPIASPMTEEYLEERAKRGSRAKYEAVLAKVPDVEPEEYDRLN